jgi:protein phosphatase
MKITVSDPSLVLLVGAAGCGKSTFARKHFRPTEVVSSDFCRGLVADDENDQSASRDAFDVLHLITARRLARRRLTVIDATNVRAEARAPLLAMARHYACDSFAIVFDLPEEVCRAWDQRRARSVGLDVIRQQREHLRRSLDGLPREGFLHVYVLSSPEEVAAAVVERRAPVPHLEQGRWIVRQLVPRTPPARLEPEDKGP